MYDTEAKHDATERYALLVRQELDDIRFQSKFHHLTKFPVRDVHHSTREFKAVSVDPTEKEICAFNLGIRCAIEVSIRILQEGKFDKMTPEDVYNVLQDITNMARS